MSQRLTITFDDEILELLRAEAHRRTASQKQGKVSVAQLINEYLGLIYADQIAQRRKEKLQQQVTI